MKPTIPRAALLALACNLPLAASAQVPGADPPRAARAPEDKAQLERRLASVALLIEKSSAAQQIEASANAQAIAMRGSARELQQQAAAAFAAGRHADASGQLDQAAKMMFSAVRLAAPEQLAGAKSLRDFDARMESVKALLAAQKRIGAEKKLGPKDTQAIAALEDKARAAGTLAAAGQVDQARAQLDQVYLTVKVSIEAMRDGDTLVRSLQFASKHEEFEYELDRYETHKMLCKVLLDEKRAANAGLDGMVQKYLEQAARLRDEADGLGTRKDYEGGVKKLEDATRELVRAIRSAGVYIPG